MVSPPSPFLQTCWPRLLPGPGTPTYLSPSETHRSEQPPLPDPSRAEQPAGSRLSPARVLGPTGVPGNKAATDLSLPPLGKDGGLERAGLKGSVLSHESRVTWGGASKSRSVERNAPIYPRGCRGDSQYLKMHDTS